MGWFGKSEKVETLYGNAAYGNAAFWKHVAGRWASMWHEAKRLLRKVEDELAAEKAKHCCCEATLPTTYTITFSDPWQLTAKPADPEAERIAKLPKCGTTKKCPACGETEFKPPRLWDFDTSANKMLPKDRQMITTDCATCGCRIQERPLFNKGRAS